MVTFWVSVFEASVRLGVPLLLVALGSSFPNAAVSSTSASKE